MIEVGKDLTDAVIRNGATVADVQRVIDEAVPSVPESAHTNGASVNGNGKNGHGQIPKKRKIADMVIDLADVTSPGSLPLLFGKYLLLGSIHWFTGQTGIGKSTWLYNVATSLAEGTPLWDIPCPRVRVLYVDLETGDVGRAIKVERLYKESPRVRGQLFFLPERLSLPEELPDLLAFVQDRKVDLVIFDTARRCFSVRDENDNAEFYARILPTLDALKSIGVASLTAGHPAKNGNGSARGAGAQEDAGDVNLSFTMHGGTDKDDPKGIVALRVTKNRLLGLDIPPLLLRRVGGDQFRPMTKEEVGEDAAASSAASPAKPLTKMQQCADQILLLMQSNKRAFKHTELVTQLDILGFKSGTAKKSIAQLQDAGQIEHDLEEGYRLPPSTEALIE